jgi:hypothetical protein
MLNRIQIYVSFIVLLACAGSAAVFLVSPPIGRDLQRAVLAISVLTLAAQLLNHAVRGGILGSISFFPILATVVLSPNWLAVVAIFVTRAATALTIRQPLIKVVFNSAQFAFAGSLSVLVYLAVGGTSFLTNPVGAAGLEWHRFVPVLMVAATFMLANGLAVAGAVALNEQKAFVPIWWNILRGSIAYDLLASPVVYLLVWLYAQFGFWGVIVFAAPLLLVRQFYKTNSELERVNQELLELMVKAIEARDPYTSGHSRRVSQYSKIIARAIGLGGSEIERVGIAALLHDVGKIHEIYAPILRKPEKLSPGEWAVMQTHPIKSAELVATVSHLSDIVAPVRHHHENWDGTGYPDGLAGDMIPLGARIVLFADTIDAMTTDRPYRKALTEQQVRSELVKFRGKQFDPEMCDRLLASPMFGLLFAPNQRLATPERVATTAKRMEITSPLRARS